MEWKRGPRLEDHAHLAQIVPRRTPSARAKPTPRGAGRRRLVDFALPEDLVRWESTITAFIARHVEAAGAKGVVVGSSGGLDSALGGALCV